MLDFSGDVLKEIIEASISDYRFFDFLDNLRMDHGPNVVINERVINWLTTPDHNDEVWLTLKDGEEIVNNKVSDQYGKPDTSPSLLENIANHVERETT